MPRNESFSLVARRIKGGANELQPIRADLDSRGTCIFYISSITACRCGDATFFWHSSIRFERALRVRGESNTLKGSSLASSGRFATVARPIHAASTTSRLR